jgi:hypothetical protein
MRTNEKQDQPEKEVKANQKTIVTGYQGWIKNLKLRGKNLPSLMDAKPFCGRKHACLLQAAL